MVKTLSTYAGLALLLIGLAFFVFSNAQKTDASSFPGTGYNARQIVSTNVGTTSIKSISGEIGSIVISSTSPVATVGTMMAFYDTASTTQATSTMTAVFTLGAKGAVTPPAGTYTFDVAFGKGIQVWVDPSFNGSYTITYR